MNSKSVHVLEIACEIGGVDPAIIRELSGIYKPFPEALKELISNAYDADSESVTVRLSDNFEQIELIDDGLGMSPFEFRGDFTKLGGSYKRAEGELTAKGRRKIGSKGIGFLAVARYCSGMEIVSTSTRKYSGLIKCKPKGDRIDLLQFLNVPIDRSLVAPRLRIISVTCVSASKRTRWLAGDYQVDSKGWLRLGKKWSAASGKQLEIKYAIDCTTLEFKATLNYDYLLSLENKKDLTEIADFCKLEIYPLERKDERVAQHYTKITLMRLKDFVVRELKAHKRTGRVRNVESKSGIERFIWHLRRCTPVRYELPPSIQAEFGESHLGSREIESFNRVVFSGLGREDIELTRPVWGTDNECDLRTADTVTLPVEIDRDGLKARGYICGHSEAIFPSEYRGIAVRVSNVQIGPPSFLGLEETVSGPTKAILSQITGEVNVLQGLDAVDALNPGRNSFYEENPHYKLLKNHIAGDGEGLNGLLGRVIDGIVSRVQVLSAVKSHISKANQYRDTLINLSMAINHYGTNGGRALKQVFLDESVRANGLSERSTFEKLPGPRIGGFRVIAVQDFELDQQIDFVSKTIHLNVTNDRWNDQIFVLGSHYSVMPKIGRGKDALCEIDTEAKKIYVNWAHPLRQQMGDVAFLKSAVAWKLSYYACRGDIEAMMDLALNLVTFNGA